MTWPHRCYHTTDSFFLQRNNGTVHFYAKHWEAGARCKKTDQMWKPCWLFSVHLRYKSTIFCDLYNGITLMLSWNSFKLWPWLPEWHEMWWKIIFSKSSPSTQSLLRCSSSSPSQLIISMFSAITKKYDTHTFHYPFTVCVEISPKLVNFPNFLNCEKRSEAMLLGPVFTWIQDEPLPSPPHSIWGGEKVPFLSFEYKVAGGQVAAVALAWPGLGLEL